MSGRVRISELPLADSAEIVDYVPTDQENGTTRKVTVGQISLIAKNYTDRQIAAERRERMEREAYMFERAKEYVSNREADLLPLMDGEVAIGDSPRFAQENHVHPTDTSRASIDIYDLVAEIKRRLDGLYQNDSPGMYIPDNLLDAIYHVGSIYESVENVSPAFFIGGTWTVFGAGRVLVGVGQSDRNFPINETAGQSGVSLTAAFTPLHSHQLSIPRASATTATHSHPFSTNTTGAHGRHNATNTGHTHGNHHHSGTTNTASTAGVSVTTNTVHTSITGSNPTPAHNNLQPYTTCFRWVRTA